MIRSLMRRILARVMSNPDRKRYHLEFKSYLNAQGLTMQRPLALIAMVGWLDFAFRTDPQLHPEYPDLLIFRLGLSAAGMIALALTFSKKLRGEGLGLLHLLLSYTLLTCSYFTGRIAHDANYVSGLQIVILIVTFIPLELKRIYLYYLLSIALFLTGLFLYRPPLDTPAAHYSMNNLVIAYVLGFVIGHILDRTRFNIFINQYRLKHANDDLAGALKNIKTLRGLLPICASCKRVRDDKGYWNQVETYLQQHSEVEISHGLCQECSDRLYGGEEWYKHKKRDDG